MHLGNISLQKNKKRRKGKQLHLRSHNKGKVA